MPTPFCHLHLAEELINHPRLPTRITSFLQAWRCDFLFGSTAPDVQVVSGLARQVTHFFNLPIQVGDQPAWDLMLENYPQLNGVETLPHNQVAFIAGYLCHLQADWSWVKEIFTPIFGPRCSWGTFRQRLYYHNILRAYLDLHTLPLLNAGMHDCLSQVEPKCWLPFVSDSYLRQWRDFLYQQLKPGATPKTIEVFSSRQGISAPEYYALLESDERMQNEVFAHISLQRVQAYRQAVIHENMHLLSNYLAFSLHPVSISVDRSKFQRAQS